MKRCFYCRTDAQDDKLQITWIGGREEYMHVNGECPLPTKTREGDQPLPVGNGQPVTDVVVAKFREREKLGISRYGSTLRTFNGRDALKDALEEKYDELQYMTQLLLERDASVEQSATLLTQAFIAKKERDGDFVSPRERVAYELGVIDAARIYFLVAKKVREEANGK